MPSENHTVEIVVCLGSSCFVRGNAENLAILKNYKSQGHNDSIRLTGCLCQDHCKESPNLMIDGERYSVVTPEELEKLLQKLDCTAKASHGTT